jgi:hypothetical protein
MHATAILHTIRARGGQVTREGDTIRVGKTRGVLTDELRQAICAEKAAILTILAAEQPRAQMPRPGDDLVAVKVWSAGVDPGRGSEAGVQVVTAGMYFGARGRPKKGWVRDPLPYAPLWALWVGGGPPIPSENLNYC